MADMNVKGGYFAPSNYLKVNEGGSHEENPNGGVQIGVDQNGTPNMLEQGEPVYNDFVYSDNIEASPEFLEKHNLPKKYEGWLYSRIADDLFEEYSATPLDPISKSGADVMLTRLAECQEEQKQAAEQQELEQMLASLSPEEMQALEQELAMMQQQQMAQQAGPSPEEQMAMQQQTPMESVPAANPEELAMAQEQQMPAVMATGGQINRFDKGGRPGWFTRLTMNAAMADPFTLAVAQSAGWKQDENGDWTQHDMDEPGAAELRESLNQISQIPLQIMTGGVLEGMIGAAEGASALSKAERTARRGAKAGKLAKKVEEVGKDLSNSRQLVSDLTQRLDNAMSELSKAMSKYGSAASKAETAGTAGGAKTKALKQLAKATTELNKWDSEVKGLKSSLDAARVSANANWWENAGAKILNGIGNVPGKIGDLLYNTRFGIAERYSRLHPVLRDIINSTGSGLALTYTASPTIKEAADAYRNFKGREAYMDSITPRGPVAPPRSIDDVQAASPVMQMSNSSEPEFDWSWLEGVNGMATGGPINKFVEGAELELPLKRTLGVNSMTPDNGFMNLAGRGMTGGYHTYHTFYGNGNGTPVTPVAPVAPAAQPATATSSVRSYTPSYPSGTPARGVLNPMMDRKNYPYIDMSGAFAPRIMPVNTSNWLYPVPLNTDMITTDINKTLYDQENAFRNGVKPDGSVSVGMPKDALAASSPYASYDDVQATLNAQDDAWMAQNGLLRPVNIDDPTDEMLGNIAYADNEWMEANGLSAGPAKSTTSPARPYNRLSTVGRYFPALADAALLINNIAQPEDKYYSAGYHPEQVYNKLGLIDPRYMPVDVNRTENALVNQRNGMMRLLANSGIGPGLPAAYIAADASAQANMGNARAQDLQTNNQLYNQALAGANANSTAISQNDFAVDRYNAQNRMDAQYRNIPLSLQLQMLNNQAESQKWAGAVSPLISRISDNIYGNATQNWNMNMVNSNPYFDGYGMSSDGWINYLASAISSRKAIEDAERQLQKSKEANITSCGGHIKTKK